MLNTSSLDEFMSLLDSNHKIWKMNDILMPVIECASIEDLHIFCCLIWN